MAVGSMLIHLSISEDEKKPRSAPTLTRASNKFVVCDKNVEVPARYDF